jgi:hypothetical protein
MTPSGTTESSARRGPRGIDARKSNAVGSCEQMPSGGKHCTPMRSRLTDASAVVYRRVRARANIRISAALRSTIQPCRIDCGRIRWVQ